MGIAMLIEAIQTIVVVVGVTVFCLTMAARRYPQVEWLQHFRVRDMRTEEQKHRARRRANIMGGAQFILFGLAIPPGYAILDLMLFSSMTQAEMIVVFAIALVCIAGGITAIVRARSL